MRLSFADVKDLLLTSYREISDDDVPTLAAAIAYYTVFSLPPLLVLLVALAGLILGPEKIIEGLSSQAGSAIGDAGADAVRTMIENASAVGTSIGSRLAGFVALLFGATGAFGQLQKALNRAWEVEEVKQEGGILSLVMKRVLSFGMVLTVAFFLLVSLVLTAVLSAVGDAATSAFGSGLAGTLLQIVNFFVGLVVTGALFGVLFRVLPDAQIAWRDVWVGAGVTAVLFTLGKAGLAFYLANADPGSAFGAAGALALLLVWIYYSALILLVGAEFTQAWAEKFGKGIEADAPGPGSSGSKASGSDAPIHPIALPRDPAPY